jgi:hypothetical protein
MHLCCNMDTEGRRSPAKQAVQGLHVSAAQLHSNKNKPCAKAD